jgi:hypothetical protein
MHKAIIGSLVLWPAYLVLHVVLLLIGFVVIPVAAFYRRYYWADDVVHWLPRWMKPWDNYEHGIAGFAGYKPKASLMWRIICWSAFRNTVNGLRHMFGISVDPERIGYVGNSRNPEVDALGTNGKTYWAFTWQGFLAGFKLARAQDHKMTEIWIGWKFLPVDADGISDWRTNAVGFAIQPYLKWDY